MVQVEDVEEALTENTAIVSIHWANNEVGSIQPINEISALCKDRNVPFHCDAVQGIGLLPVPSPTPDLMTIAAHKFYGPKGIAALIVNDGINLKPQIMGGGQEFDLRAGTEDTPAIVGMAKALELAMDDVSSKPEAIRTLRDSFVEDVLTIEGTTLNGHPEKRLPNFASIHFAEQSAEQLVIQLDMQGICASSGAACTTGATEPSHVLQAMGQSSKESMQNVRFSLGRFTTTEDLQKTVEVLRTIL